MKKHYTLRHFPHAIACLSLGLAASTAVGAAQHSQESSTDLTVHAGASQPTLRQDAGEFTTVGGMKFANLTFDDAVSRAERTKKLLVVFWAGDSPLKEAEFGTRVFGDKGVQDWIAANATAVWINALERKKDAKKNGLSSDLLPTVDILDISRGGRIDRLRGDVDATQFLAAVYGSGNAERPSGDSVHEPFSWLAWANARFRNSQDQDAGDDAVAGYEWCLQNADKYRPGFRAKYLEFLLQRIANCKQRSANAVEVLFREHHQLAAKIRIGTATEADVFELTRVDFWTRKELMTRDLFVTLRGRGETFDQYRLWLFPTVVPVLGRFEQYDEILSVVGQNHLSMFQQRINALSAGDQDQKAEDVEEEGEESSSDDKRSDDKDDASGAGQKTGSMDSASEGGESDEVTALDFARADSRSDIIDDASWVYEALLKVGRGKDAHDLMELITTTFPVNKAFGLFTERALRVEIWAAAAEIADLGMAVLDERGQKRMQRLLRKIPTDTSKGGADKD